MAMYPPPPPPPPPAKMSSGAKLAVVVACLIVGACAVCVGASVVGGYWVKSQAPGLMDDARNATQEARAFAQGRAQSDCVAEGLRRNDACGDMEIRCQVRVSTFLHACLRAAAATPGFCDSVPPSSAVMPSAQWRAEYCAAQGRANNRRCPNLMGSVQGYCDRPGPLPAAPFGPATTDGGAR